jgi:hypothetical protein
VEKLGAVQLYRFRLPEDVQDLRSYLGLPPPAMRYGFGWLLGRVEQQKTWSAIQLQSSAIHRKSSLEEMPRRQLEGPGRGRSTDVTEKSQLNLDLISTTMIVDQDLDV